ncbi:MAG: alpha-1,2-fucosyltransferase [Rhodobacteraceae bacterium]|nr:MAG: alpha-1,2-fucosyltransferase [Paracoccaceae bacterium]
MIYSRLHGRLGNQMFQYAAGRALAERHGVPLVLDRRALDPAWVTVADVFRLELSQGSLPPSRSEGLLRYGLWRAFGRRPRFVREKGLSYNPRFGTLGDGVYLHGYWQSERYFAGIADRIRADFTFGDFATRQGAQMADRILATPGAISLHVRRGDYTSLPGHALCSQAYYERALARVTEGFDAEPVVFVFSDDPDWARDNLPLPVEKVLVDISRGQAAPSDHEDMRLMSLCRHNIIANSSFSWWGAWLNRTPGKVVAAPATWFTNPRLVNRDILPPGWLRIEG